MSDDQKKAVSEPAGPSRVRMVFSSLILLTGLLYVGRNETGILHWLSEVLRTGVSEVFPFAEDQIRTVQTWLVRIGVHDKITLRIAIGFTLILIGCAGLILDKPKAAVRAFLEVVGTVFSKGSIEERESNLKDAIEGPVLSRTFKDVGEQSLLVAGVVRWFVKGTLLALVLAVAVSLAVRTYFTYSQSVVVSNLIKDKLEMYLIQVQLGGVPVHAKMQSADIEALQGQMKQFAIERSLLKETLNCVDFLDIRFVAKPESTGVVLDRLKNTTKVLKENVVNYGAISSYPLGDIDEFYYFSFMLAAVYVGLNELNSGWEKETDEWVGKIIEHLDEKYKTNSEMSLLALSLERAKCLRNAINYSRKSNWTTNTDGVNAIWESSQEFLTLATEMPRDKDQIRSEYNGRLMAAKQFRVAGYDGRDVEASVASSIEKLRHCLGGTGEDKCGKSGSEVYIAYAKSGRVAEAFFSENGNVYLDRAEVFAGIVSYFRKKDALGTGLTDEDFALLKAIEEDSRVPRLDMPNGIEYETFTREKFFKDLETMLVAEEILAIDRAEDMWPARPIWKSIDEQLDICDGVFLELRRSIDPFIVIDACRIVGVPCPFKSYEEGVQ